MSRSNTLDKNEAADAATLIAARIEQMGGWRGETLGGCAR